MGLYWANLFSGPPMDLQVNFFLKNYYYNIFLGVFPRIGSKKQKKQKKYNR